MNSLRERLKSGDPVASEPMLAVDEVASLRAIVLAETRHEVRRVWGLTAVLAVFLVGVVSGGTWLIRRSASAVPVETARIEVAPETRSAPARQQLQFSTPGGTRVFWVFDPSFDMR